MDNAKIEAIKKSFTPEQAEIFNILMGDKEKLHQEWLLCNNLYAKCAAVINAPTTGPEVRLVLRKASTDYWSRRRLDLERTMEELGMNDTLVEWRKEIADAKKK